MVSKRCPECRLINAANAQSCRRCGALLLPAHGGFLGGSGSGRRSRILIGGAVAALIVVLVTAYVWNRPADGVSGNVPVPDGGFSEPVAPAPGELDEVKELCRDFTASMNRNMSDPAGRGFELNQALATETLDQVRDRFPGISDPTARQHMDRFSLLLGKLHHQLTSYIADNERLGSEYERLNRETERIEQDPDLSPEEKSDRQRELRRKYFDASDQTRVTSRDIEATMLALRSLAAS